MYQLTYKAEFGHASDFCGNKFKVSERVKVYADKSLT
jgi:hypothetical protein